MQNDGSEVAELHELNAFDIQSLRIKLKLAQGLSIDIGKQKDQAFGLIVECRDLLDLIIDVDKDIQKDVFDMIAKIDEFYPQP